MKKLKLFLFALIAETQMTSFTISSIITSIGSQGGSFPGGGFPGGGFNPGGHGGRP